MFANGRCINRSQPLVSFIAAAVLAACLPLPAALADGPSRVVVVRGQPGGTQVPLQPNERIGAYTSVQLPGVGPVVVVRIDIMPDKADFNIITPGGVSHPFKRTEDRGNGVTVEYEVQVLNTPGGDRFRVVAHIKRNGAEIGQAAETYPAGSQYVPDPPQPPGTMVAFPDGVPLPPAEETLVLSAAGIPDLPGPQAYAVPSGDLTILSPGAAPAVVHLRGGAAKGDLNCDGFVTVGDISGFVLALTNPASYEASFPECDRFAADVNHDELITVGDIGGMVLLLTGG